MRGWLLRCASSGRECGLAQRTSARKLIFDAVFPHNPLLNLYNVHDGALSAKSDSLVIRFRARRIRPPDSSLDFSSRAGTDLFLSVFFIGLPDPRTHRPAR